MAFRPCIDLRNGRVVQIVGGTLSDDGSGTVVNHVSDQSAAEIAALYRRDSLAGGHVIMLGPGNENAAREALAAYPGALQIGGGITPENAAAWLDWGASHVIVTSWLFPGGVFSPARLAQMSALVGPARLVVDLSCRRLPHGEYRVATDRWQTITETRVDAATIRRVEAHCSELLVHAADVEGQCRGIDEDLVQRLGEWVSIPTTYAGGARDLEDIARVEHLSQEKVDLTIGSALDIFGGTRIRYTDAARQGRKTQSGHGVEKGIAPG
jgi:phosphoribosylformimino-5-aminoimidazole carboxamide ribotide isomerase